MTYEEAIKVLEKVVENSSSSEELRRFKEGLMKLTQEGADRLSCKKLYQRRA